ncbi:MAG: c-type cytochrome [Gammaproteobacteria bacterium]|jgi:mono/diheme cytochrome c family protein
MRHFVLLLFLVFLLVLTGCGSGEDMGGDKNTNPDAPYFGPIPTPSVLGGDPVNFTVQANDPNGMNITLTYDGSQGPYDDPFAAGASFNPTTGEFSWNTATTDTGNYSVVFTATNDAVPPLSSDVSVTIHIQDLVAYGEGVYNQHCRSCHGADGAGGSAGAVQCSSATTISEALGLVQDVNGVGNMSGIAGQLDNQSTDINAMAEYLWQANPDPNHCVPLGS